MADKNYSKRELDTAFASITEHLKKQDDILVRIETQTTKTNGRVNLLYFLKNAILWTIGIFVALSPLIVEIINLKK